MSRRDWDDRPRKKSNMPVLIAVAVGVAGLVVMAGGFFVVMHFLDRAGQRKEDPAAKVYTREEFRAKVIGKTGPQVIEAIGRPKSASDNPDGSPGIWRYYDIVHNPSTGKTGWAVVRFEGGKVNEVTW